MTRLVALVLALALAGCIEPKVEICNVKSACLVEAPATVNPVALPKVLP